jgi:hypothetical protein
MKIKGLKGIFLIFSFPIFLASCGGIKKTISDVSIDQSVIDRDSYIHVEATLDLGNIYLPDFKAPIKLNGQDVGEVTLGSDLVAIDLNVSVLAPKHETLGELPNGSKLPLIKNNPVIVLPLGRSDIKIYVSLVNGAKAIGVSIPVKELDQVNRYAGYFPPFMVKDITVAAGVYTSEDDGKSGIAAFFDLTPVLEVTSPVQRSDDGYITLRVQSDKSAKEYELNLDSRENSRRTQRRIDREIYDLHRKRKTVTVY